MNLGYKNSVLRMIFQKEKQQKFCHNCYSTKHFFLILHRAGALAQLARAFDWQSRGHRFDSDMLHSAEQRVTIFQICSPLFLWMPKPFALSQETPVGSTILADGCQIRPPILAVQRLAYCTLSGLVHIPSFKIPFAQNQPLRMAPVKPPPGCTQAEAK